jgi:hypothetical protein
MQQVLGRAKIYSSLTRQSLVEMFLDEAGNCIGKEQGRVSIPTAHALMLRYFTMPCMGRDRAGRVFRQQAIDMVQRLDLQNKVRSIAGNSARGIAEKKRIPKALWGLFVVET